MIIDTSGNIKNGAGTVVWHTGSDERIKENVETITNAIDIVKNLRGVKFDFKEGVIPDSENMSKQYGFIAQEVQKVVPDLVVPWQEKIFLSEEESYEDVLGVDERLGFTAVLLEAVKALVTRVETLEAQVAGEE
jgi:hypothetical protein